MLRLSAVTIMAEPIYVINGFYMAMREKYTGQGASISYMLVEWDSATLSWEDFRGKVCLASTVFGCVQKAPVPASLWAEGSGVAPNREIRTVASVRRQRGVDASVPRCVGKGRGCLGP